MRVIFSFANLAIWQGLYRSGFVYDVIWIMPYAFYPWAASQAPTSAETGLESDQHALTPSRPWVVFSALCLIPLFDYGIRQVVPLGPLEDFSDLSTAITIFSVLPLLMARLAVEHGEARQADRKRRLLAAATEQADELISIMRPDGGMEHANHTFCRMIGYTPDEIVQMNAAEFLAEDSRSQLSTIATAAQNDGIWRGTLVRARPDGSTFLTSCTMTALADDAGRVTQLVAVERDVTSETELRDQLIHAERLAAAGQLVSGVAHELNNPLQSVVGFAELLLDNERREEAREDLERILSEANRAAKIVQNLLTFVRRSNAERVVASLNDIVQSAIELRAYEFAVANIEIDADYGHDLPPVRVNREEIQQVLLNLLLNAEHAMKNSNVPGKLRVRTTVGDAGVVVEVHDNGPGVLSTVAGRIFEPFFSTKEVGQGTGLGLSIALGIVEAHRGTLVLADAESRRMFSADAAGLRRHTVGWRSRVAVHVRAGRTRRAARPCRRRRAAGSAIAAAAVDAARIRGGSGGRRSDGGAAPRAEPLRPRDVRRKDAERRRPRSLRQHRTASSGRAGQVRVHQRRYPEPAATLPQRFFTGAAALEAVRCGKAG